MVEVLPFRGLRFADDIPLSQVTAPPYDAIDDELAEELRRRHPHNVVRLERGLGTGRTEGSVAGPDPYERVADTYRRWIDDGILRPDTRPCLYVYQQWFVEDGRRRRQRGVFGALGLRPWETGEVLPHEHIYRPPVEDRLRLLRALPANTSAVFGLAEREPDPVPEVLDAVVGGPPDASFEDRDGVSHRMWLLTDPSLQEVVRAAYEDVPLLMADGHHRYTTALEYRSAHPDEPGVDHILALVVGGNGPVVRPNHRIVRDDRGDVARRLAGAGLHVQPVASDGPPSDDRPEDRALSELRRADGPAFILLTRDADGAVQASLVAGGDARPSAPPGSPDDRGGPTGDLDVALVHDVLTEILDADEADPAVGSTSEAREAASQVRDGSAGAAFLVRPVTVEQVRRVAETGLRMPPKSTSFHPKPRTGLVIRPLRP